MSNYFSLIKSQAFADPFQTSYIHSYHNNNIVKGIALNNSGCNFLMVSAFPSFYFFSASLHDYSIFSPFPIISLFSPMITLIPVALPHWLRLLKKCGHILIYFYIQCGFTYSVKHLSSKTRYRPSIRFAVSQTHAVQVLLSFWLSFVNYPFLVLSWRIFISVLFLFNLFFFSQSHDTGQILEMFLCQK